MRISSQMLEQLLYEEEGSTLDFKRDQYPFEGAGNDAKSELLKDILAFVNAWRRSDAYILIGVDEVRGGRSLVVGVTTHLDDAKLQQFVNSKTQRPVHFSYYQAAIDNRDIGIIHIPPQERPVYLVKDYGKLVKQKVYVRRSSSTDIAASAEIVRMGQAFVEGLDSMPLIELQLFDFERLTPLGNSLEIETVNLTVPGDSEIPDYGVARFPLGPNMYFTMPSCDKNRNYYRDTALYMKTTLETHRVDFTVYNAGNIVAKDVRIELVVPDPDGNLIFRDAADMPNEPSADFLLSHVAQPAFNLDVNVQTVSEVHRVTLEFGKIQPKASAQTYSGLFIGSRCPQIIELKARIFADNLPAPRETALTLQVKPCEDSLSVQKLMTLVQGRTPNKATGDDDE